MSQILARLLMLIVLLDGQLPEDKDDGDVAMEEDAADVAARRKAAAKAKEEAELRKRSQVLSQTLEQSLCRFSPHVKTCLCTCTEKPEPTDLKC